MYKEIIVVEGVHDRQKLESILPNIDCIITNGSAISQETIETIKMAQKTRGVILLLDPDFPGKQITQVIIEQVEGVKIAFLPKKSAISKNKKKVGIEHASAEAILLALSGLYSLSDTPKIEVTREDLIKWHLLGEPQSQSKRAFLCEALRIPPCNGKALLKWLNRLEITKNQIEEVMI